MECGALFDLLNAPNYEAFGYEYVHVYVHEHVHVGITPSPTHSISRRPHFFQTTSWLELPRHPAKSMSPTRFADRALSGKQYPGASPYSFSCVPALQVLNPL
jgi:hypothetical protein